MVGEVAPTQSVNVVQNQQVLQQTQTINAQQNLVLQAYKVPVGAQIQAVVTGVDKNGNLLLKLGGSDLLLSSPVALAKGAVLELKLTNTSNNVTFQLLSVDGKLPPTQAQAVSNQLLANPQQAQQQPVLLKLVSNQPQQTAQQVAQSAAVPVQESVIFSNSQGLPVRAILLQPNVENLRNLQQQTKILSTLSPDIGGEELEVLGKDAQLELRITGIQARPQSQAQSGLQALVATAVPSSQLPETQAEQVQLSRLDKSVFSGQVAASNPNYILLDTPLGRLSIPNLLSNEVAVDGAEVFFEIENFALNRVAPEVDAETDLRTLLNKWPNLRAAVAENSQLNPNKIGGFEGVFSVRIAKFFNAVKNNDIENWLSGEIVKDLDYASAEAVKGKLAADFANISKLYAEVSNTGWQTILFPVYDGKDLLQARFFVKKIADDAVQTDGKRFVVEFSTGYFGEIQLDGLVRKVENLRRFDLMVRSSRPLDNDVRAGINEIFNNTAEISGVRGSVAFGTLDSAAITPSADLMTQIVKHSGFEV